MSGPGNWEGLPGTEVEHRTVGPHRAWCYDCAEWCWSSAPHCMCCEFRSLPAEYHGLSLREVIDKARAVERQHIWESIGQDTSITVLAMDAARADEREKRDAYWRARLDELVQAVEGLPIRLTDDPLSDGKLSNFVRRDHVLRIAAHAREEGQ